MEMLSNAVVSDLVSRSISFFFSKCEKQAASAVQEDLHRLRHLLLRSGTIVEEAERRQVTNRAMLQQLKAFRDEMFRGHYVLDAVRCRALPEEGEDGREEDDDDEELGRRQAFSLSRFNTAKRLRVPSLNSKTTAVLAVADAADANLMVRSLEAMIADLKEFVVFLTSHPPLLRQPYSAHLSVDKCMFGRQMEKDAVMEFLLQPESPGSASLGVLPIVGLAHIGKSTLIQNVCDDERVRNHFSLILFYNGNDLKDATMASLRDNCAVKHQNGKASGERLLIVVELLDDVDEETWRTLYQSSEASMPHGSKMIIASRCENIARFGTTQPLRLKFLPIEPFWYFFKTLVFGSDDPRQHRKMASLALEMAHVMQGSYFFAFLGAILLRDNFNTKTWSRILFRLRQYLQRNASLIGEYPDDVKPTKDQPRFTWSLIKDKPNTLNMLHKIRQIGSTEEVPETTFIDLLTGRPQPRGECEILFWKSRIPPYYSYVSTCEIRDM